MRDPDVLRLNAILENNIGTMYRDWKQYSAMQNHFGAAIAIYETLYAEHPENTLWRDCLAEESNEIASYYIFDVPESLKRRELALYYAFRATNLSGEQNAKYLSTLKAALNSVGTNDMRALATKVDAKIRIQKERATAAKGN